MTDALRERVAASIAADPDPDSRAELQALLDREAEASLGAVRRAADLRHGGPARPPGAGPARMNVATVRQASAGLAAYVARARARRGRGRRPRRPPRLRALRRGGGGGLLRRRADDLPPAAAGPDAAARLRRAAARLRGGRDGDREPQPAAGQRLQGLPRRWRADHRRRPTREIAADDRRGRPARRACRSATAARRVGERARRGLPRGDPGARCPPPTRATSRIVYTPLHGVGAALCPGRVRAGRLRAPRTRGRAGRARSRLPDRRVPEPRGAGRDGPRARAAAEAPAPTSCSPTIPTPIGSPSPIPGAGRLAPAHRQRDRRAARPTTCSTHAADPAARCWSPRCVVAAAARAWPRPPARATSRR